MVKSCRVHLRAISFKGIIGMLKITVIPAEYVAKLHTLNYGNIFHWGMIYNKLHLYFEVFGYWIHSAQSSEKSQPFLPVHGEPKRLLLKYGVLKLDSSVIYVICVSPWVVRFVCVLSQSTIIRLNYQKLFWCMTAASQLARCITFCHLNVMNKRNNYGTVAYVMAKTQSTWTALIGTNHVFMSSFSVTQVLISNYMSEIETL